MSYENAPATRLVATHCVACGRPLVDPISVEAGMGPDCREKYGHAGPEGVTEESRHDVAKRVHALAAGVSAAEQVGHLLIIRAHGFEKLADRLEERMCAVEISQVEGMLVLATPFDPSFVDDLKANTWGRRWDAANKRWLVPADDTSKKSIWAVIRRHFAGSIGRGPQGLFPIEVRS